MSVEHEIRVTEEGVLICATCGKDLPGEEPMDQLVAEHLVDVLESES